MQQRHTPYHVPFNHECILIHHLIHPHHSQLSAYRESHLSVRYTTSTHRLPVFYLYIIIISPALAAIVLLHMIILLYTQIVNIMSV